MDGSADGDELEAETSDSDSDASTNADDAEVCEGHAIVSTPAASILPGTPYIHDRISVLEVMIQAAAHSCAAPYICSSTVCTCSIGAGDGEAQKAQGAQLLGQAQASLPGQQPQGAAAAAEAVGPK